MARSSASPSWLSEPLSSEGDTPERKEVQFGLLRAYAEQTWRRETVTVTGHDGFATLAHALQEAGVELPRRAERSHPVEDLRVALVNAYAGLKGEALMRLLRKKLVDTRSFFWAIGLDHSAERDEVSALSVWPFYLLAVLEPASKQVSGVRPSLDFVDLSMVANLTRTQINLIRSADITAKPTLIQPAGGPTARIYLVEMLGYWARLGRPIAPREVENKLAVPCRHVLDFKGHSCKVVRFDEELNCFRVLFRDAEYALGISDIQEFVVPSGEEEETPKQERTAFCKSCKDPLQELQRDGAPGRTGKRCTFWRCREAAKLCCMKAACDYYLCQEHSKVCGDEICLREDCIATPLGGGFYPDSLQWHFLQHLVRQIGGAKLDAISGRLAGRNGTSAGSHAPGPPKRVSQQGEGLHPQQRKSLLASLTVQEMLAKVGREEQSRPSEPKRREPPPPPAAPAAPWKPPDTSPRDTSPRSAALVSDVQGPWKPQPPAIPPPPSSLSTTPTPSVSGAEVRPKRPPPPPPQLPQSSSGTTPTSSVAEAEAAQLKRPPPPPLPLLQSSASTTPTPSVAGVPPPPPGGDPQGRKRSRTLDEVKALLRSGNEFVRVASRCHFGLQGFEVKPGDFVQLMGWTPWVQQDPSDTRGGSTATVAVVADGHRYQGEEDLDSFMIYKAIKDVVKQDWMEEMERADDLQFLTYRQGQRLHVSQRWDHTWAGWAYGSMGNGPERLEGMWELSTASPRLWTLDTE